MDYLPIISTNFWVKKLLHVYKGEMYIPRDPITLSDDEQGVYNHLRQARCLGSTTILRR